MNIFVILLIAAIVVLFLLFWWRRKRRLSMLRNASGPDFDMTERYVSAANAIAIDRKRERIAMSSGSAAICIDAGELNGLKSEEKNYSGLSYLVFDIDTQSTDLPNFHLEILATQRARRLAAIVRSLSRSQIPLAPPVPRLEDEIAGLRTEMANLSAAICEVRDAISLLIRNRKIEASREEAITPASQLVARQPTRHP